MTIQTANTDVHSSVRFVESSEVFKHFCKQNPDHYLVHTFAAVKTLEATVPMELGYYGQEQDRITVFRTAPIEALPPEEVFKEQGVVASLDLTLVCIGLAEALGIVRTLHAETYAQHPVLQAFCVLQYNSTFNVPAWNITLVLGSLSMLNVKVDATNATVLSRELQSLMNLKAN